MKLRKITSAVCVLCTAVQFLTACSADVLRDQNNQDSENDLSVRSDAFNYFEGHLDDYIRLGGSDGFVSGTALETVHYTSKQQHSDYSGYESSSVTLPVRLRAEEYMLSSETALNNYYLLSELCASTSPRTWAEEHAGMKLINAEAEFTMPVMEKGTFFATVMTGGIADSATGRAVELQNASRFSDITLSDGIAEHQLRLYPLCCLKTDCGLLFAAASLEVSEPETLNGKLCRRWIFTTQVIAPSDYEDIAFYYGGSDMALESRRESFDGLAAEITELPQYEYDIHFYGPQSPLPGSDALQDTVCEYYPAVLTEHIGKTDVNYVYHSEGKDGYLITEGAKLGIDAALMAAHFIGGNYKWGGSSPETGFDCSGLVYYVYGQLGYSIGRTANDQSKEGEHVDPEDLRPGDILCFHYGNGYCDHAGIYLGNGGFVHAASSNTGIVISMLDEYCSRGRQFEARRLVP